MATVRMVTNKDPEERHELAPVVSNHDVTVKRSLGQKFADTFISDAASEVGGYIGRIVVDTIKETIVNVVSMVLLGDAPTTSMSRYRRSRLREENTHYRAFYASEADNYGAPPRRSYDRAQPRTDYRSIVINHQPNDPFYARDKAEEIVGILRGRIEKYGEATVADLLELAGLPTARDGVDRNIGWTNPLDIGSARVSSGYLIVVRDAVRLD